MTQIFTTQWPTITTPTQIRERVCVLSSVDKEAINFAYFPAGNLKKEADFRSNKH